MRTFGRRRPYRKDASSLCSGSFPSLGGALVSGPRAGVKTVAVT